MREHDFFYTVEQEHDGQHQVVRIVRGKAIVVLTYDDDTVAEYISAVLNTWRDREVPGHDS